ncbi:aspartate/glutamate racemase family protein [Kumtagia ephedrae]|jgi:allantoin racemase|uniref:Asp/Glu/hydantoin racemase n=1 Tax=Kumtagia ephedrae TaxID=2116701 RepID=A0A2P7S122_9HYPH|nr:aspartate/glutamate racemase family protein [Mesorhizobium ephedrae]PSJ56170.1 Asp/Glu/hydantoin racemase [Mesorhizobium ephedrae]
MRIQIINPTTTEAFARKNLAAAKSVAAAGTEIVSASVLSGPASIESHYDEAVSTIGILEAIHRGEAEGIDGYVIACFGDPGYLAAREIARGPVIGIAEAAFHLASIIATRFSVVTTLARTKIICEHLLQIHGFEHQCRRVRACGLEVLELEETGMEACRDILEECRRAVAEDEAGAIVLGCAGMADLADHIQQEIGVPVVEGVTAATKLIEGIVALRLGTSKVGDLAYPLPKPLSGSVKHLEIAPRR